MQPRSRSLLSRCASWLVATVAVTACGSDSTGPIAPANLLSSARFPDCVPLVDYFPTGGWRLTCPAVAGMDSARLRLAYEAMNLAPDVRAFVVVRHGHVVAEAYRTADDSRYAFHQQSATKSVTSALVGIALREGYLTSLDQKAADFLPEYFGPDTDARKKTITLRHLLTMTAGLECDDSDSNFWLIRSHRDWAAATIAFPLVAEPGEQFMYDSAAMHLLSVILTRQTQQNAFQFAQTHLFQPLGIDVNHWPTDPQHNSEGAAGLALTPRDMAKFGYLYLNGGRWDGEAIIPEWFVRESTQKHSEGGNPEPAAYGYLWWVMHSVQPAAYCAAGYGGQYIIVIPDHDLVIVTTGNHELMPPPEAPVPLFFEYIVPAS